MVFRLPLKSKPSRYQTAASATGVSSSSLTVAPIYLIDIIYVNRNSFFSSFHWIEASAGTAYRHRVSNCAVAAVSHSSFVAQWIFSRSSIALKFIFSGADIKKFKYFQFLYLTIS